MHNINIISAYGCETWKLTKRTKNQPRIAQRAMVRAMLEITIRDRKSSTSRED